MLYSLSFFYRYIFSFSFDFIILETAGPISVVRPREKLVSGNTTYPSVLL